MRLTEKDRELIKLIERWGFMSVDDVCLFQDYKSKNSAVWRLNRLVEAKLIQRQKCIFGYFLYVPLDFKGLDVASFDHDQTAKYLALRISKELSCSYLTIRELRSEARQEEGVAGLNKKVPDFVLLQKEKRIAVEVELSQKSLTRQKGIIDKYIEALTKKEYMQVFYYCGTEAILSRLKNIVTDKQVVNVIKIVRLPERL